MPKHFALWSSEAARADAEPGAPEATLAVARLWSGLPQAGDEERFGPTKALWVTASDAIVAGCARKEEGVRTARAEKTRVGGDGGSAQPVQHTTRCAADHALRTTLRRA